MSTSPTHTDFGKTEEPYFVGQLRKYDQDRSAGSIACKEAGGRTGVVWGGGTGWTGQWRVK